MSTCQICGRDIKSKNGVIAHHGYTRPDSGWQTKSCMGARNLPYEISCDVIPVAIDSLKTYLFNERHKLNKMMVNPPDELQRSEFTGKEGWHMVIHKKPDDFNPKKLGGYSGYESAFSSLKYEIERNIESADRNIEYLEERLRNWNRMNVIKDYDK